MAVETFLTPAERLEHADFLGAIDPADLVLFVLNIGDGDTQLALLPEVAGVRQAIVVDVVSGGKLAALIDTLRASGFLADSSGSLPLVIATHPHADHISGMAGFLGQFESQISEFWEPGYYHPTAGYFQMMEALGASTGVRHAQPTSGYTCFIGACKVTVLAPGVGLRNRFDSYGIDVNNSSISIKLEFPAQRVYKRAGDRTYLRLPSAQAVILGADAQTLSWAQVLVDFPQLAANGSAVAQALRKARGTEPLRAAVFKVPHHASKHGLNLELAEEINPKISLISSVGGGGSYNFPHLLALESLRESVDATAQKGTNHRPDYDLGIHYTFGKDSTDTPLGSIAVVLGPTGRKRQVWRFGDEVGASVDLAGARRFS